MELERLGLELRRRTPWEAVDLALPLLRRWRGAAYRTWFGTFLPFCLVLFLALWKIPLAAAIIAWWCKPLFDRALLKVYAEAVFGEPPSLREVWRALPWLIRHTGLLGALTFGRFDMARSFHLPIRQLENQHGKAARTRRGVLGHRTRGCAIWLTVLCSNFSTFLQISSILLLAFLWPSEAPQPFDWKVLFGGEGNGDSGLWESLLSHLAWMLGETLIEPFYVAAGFMLYLNRRNELEGWDIELGFRQMARRHEEERRSLRLRQAAGLVGLGLAGLLLAQFPSDAWAEIPTEISAAASPTPSAKLSPAKQAIQAVLADPVFGHQVQGWEWRYRKDTQSEQPKEGSRSSPWFERVIQWIAESIRLLGYVGAAALAALFAFLLYRYRDAWRISPPAARAVPETLFGLDVRPDSLPEDIALASSRLLAAGEVIPALSLLYRGALVSLIHAAGVDFLPGDTEGDCRARVRGYVPADTEGYFADLLEAWTLAAYAEAPPSNERAQAFCAEWPRHFAAAADSA